jgi:RNA polymerase sigma-70 factor (ECF subfamily)
MSAPMDFEALVRSHQSAVCATAYSVLRDRARAEEVAQDAFLLAWQKLPALAEPPELPAWICGIARNLARNVARKKREVLVSDDREPTAADGPLDSLLTHESRAIANRALAALDERDREVVTLYYMGEGSHADVARALGIAEDSARQRLHRARAKLRDATSTVEATLRAARPGAAFTVACVAALAAGRTVSAEAAAAKSVPSGFALAGGAAAVIGVLAAAVLSAKSSPSSTPSSSRARSIASGSSATGSGSAAAAAIDRAAILHRISRATRTELLGRLHAARASSAAPPPAEKPPLVYDFAGIVLGNYKPMNPPPPNASAKYLFRYAITELEPLLAECHAGLPSQGTIAMRIVLTGAPDIATVVESVDIDPDGSAGAFEPSFTECMRETLYALELPPMPTADRWDVRFPFTLAPPTH